MCVCVCTRVALLWISVHDDVRNPGHDFLDQTISQHGHSLMIILRTQTHIKSQDVGLCLLRPGMFGCICFTSISCWAMLQAAPSPTASGVGTVPERRPLSCPPPLCSGSIRTRGRRRTYKAPTPVHTQTRLFKIT